MARSLFSNSFIINQSEINPSLQNDLEFLKTYLKLRKLKVLEWDNDHIVIPLNLKVSLPPRGNYNDIDIKSVENVLFVFNRLEYPYKAPRVYSDRKSFPKDGLSHLYVTKEDRPVLFCLIRGNYNEWYSNKLVSDLVVKARSWLSDAANGSLDVDGDQFDPMRLEGYEGNIVYDHQSLSDIVLNKEVYEGLSNIAFLLIRENESLLIEKDKVIYPGYEVLKVISSLEDLKSTYKPIAESLAKNEADPRHNRILLGAIIWQKDLSIDNKFPEDLPNNFNSLIDFCERYNISTSLLLNFLPLIKISGIDELPVLVAVNRPLPLIGYNSNIEIFNFYIRFHENAIKDKEIVKNMIVGYQNHSQPLTISKAKEVSGNNSPIGKVIQIGCGAVGSKFALHMIREGSVDNEYLLMDNDKVEPHNIVRYGLLSESIGMNKAIALMKTAYSLFALDKKKIKMIGLPIGGDFLFKSQKQSKLLNGCNWLLDFTASQTFENLVIEQEIPDDLKVVKAYISDGGNLGLLFIEGSSRNPRLDDLKVIVQSSYDKSPLVSKWLKDEYERGKLDNTLINVGVGCNSETTILNDSSITLHSASFFNSIKSENLEDNGENGVAYLSIIRANQKYNFRTTRIEVKPLNTAIDKISGWQIRIKNGLVDIMMSEMGQSSPIETGGVLIGLINNKTKCVHVTDVILAPPDSTSNEVCFVRGIDGLKEEVDMHKHLSGQTFGYIGEWHSHPLGPFCPSNTDIRTMQITKDKYKKDGLRMPVVMIIATPKGIISCIQ